MIRHLKIARDTALKSRTQAMVTLKTLLINAPQPLREQFIAITGPRTLIRALAALRPGPMTSPTASAKAALHALARRWLALDAEIKEHDRTLETLVRRRAPALMAAPGISTLTVAEMLVVLGDNPGRIRSEAAFAKLCGVCPIPASSGKTTRHRLNRGGNRRANAALYRVAVTRMRCHSPTRAVLPKASQPARSGDASSATSPARSSSICAPNKGKAIPLSKTLDRHRSFNALAKTINGLFKAEVIHRRGPWRSCKAVGVCHPRMGGLVQPPTPAQTDREHPTRRGGGALLCKP